MRTTQEVIEAMYAAFLAGDKDGMLAVMHDDVEVRFLGQAEVHGKAAANAFFDFAGGLLTGREASRCARSSWTGSGVPVCGRRPA